MASMLGLTLASAMRMVVRMEAMALLEMLIGVVKIVGVALCVLHAHVAFVPRSQTRFISVSDIEVAMKLKGLEGGDLPRPS
jgi:hypothetical protein